MQQLMKQISENVIRGEAGEVIELVKAAIQQGLAPKQILDEGLIAGMKVIGEQFRCHEIFLPDVLLASKAMIGGIDQIKPLLIQEGVPTLGKVVIGTVHGDLHDIGKNLVGLMLRGAGFEVIDLGKDVPPEKFLEAARKHNADVIGLSALLTTTMMVMKQVVEMVREQKLPVRVIIGGAPVSYDYSREIGADGYGYDASHAVERVKSMLGAE